MLTTIRVNGADRSADVDPRTSLLDFLRERLDLKGTKKGCDHGQCGACTVLVNGVRINACLSLAVMHEGDEVLTVEGLAEGEALHPVQQAFLSEDAFQCGYCTPGQVVAAEGLLRANPDPTLDEIRLGMSGNLCRCGAYAHIFKAVDRAARLRKGG